MTTDQRITMAKQKTTRVVDHLLDLIQFDANNEIVLYSNALSSQIPTSYAANTFNAFVRALGRYEIVRLCALWDSADIDKENIPIIIELVDNPDVINALAEEMRSHWQSKGGVLFTSEDDDPQIIAEATKLAQRSDEQFGEKQAAAARNDLQSAILKVRDVLKSERLAGIMNLRDKHLVD
jgi:AbiU2